MKIWMRLVIPLLCLALVHCGEDYDPCTPGDAGAGGGSSGVVVGAGPGVTASSGGDWGAEDDSHGYSRNTDGEICMCDARDAEMLGCVPEPPPDRPRSSGCVPVDEYDYSCQWPEQSGGSDAQPQTPSICGEVYWCCYQIESFGALNPKYGTRPIELRDAYNIWACYGEDRHTTYHTWLSLMSVHFAPLFKFDDKLPATAGYRLLASNCLTNPLTEKHPPYVCPNFPVDNVKP